MSSQENIKKLPSLGPESLNNCQTLVIILRTSQSWSIFTLDSVALLMLDHKFLSVNLVHIYLIITLVKCLWWQKKQQ